MKYYLLTVLACALSAEAHADFSIVNYNQHSDLEVNYDPGTGLPGTGTLGLEVHFDDFPPAVAHYDPSAVLWSIYSPLPLQTTNSPLGPLGYVIPQSPNPNLPVLGAAGAEEPGEELAPFFNSARIEFLAMTGPGDFVLFQDDGLGGFTTLANSTNGFTAADFLSVPLSGHDDFSWGFTQPGFYQLYIRATGNFNAANGGGTATSEVFVISFEAVSTPLPPSIFAAAFGGISLLGLRRWSAK